MLGCVGEAKPSDEQEVSCEQGLGTESDKEQTLQFGYLKLFCFRSDIPQVDKVFFKK